MDGDVPRRASYGVYISQPIRFARVCNHVTDFNARNNSQNFSNRAIGIINFEKSFLNFIVDTELISKYNVGLKKLLSEGLSKPEFYGDFVYKFKKL